MATLTLYGSDVASAVTPTTACQMSTATGGTEVGKKSTFTGSGQYGEFTSKGLTVNTSASIPAPTGNGWVYAPGAGTFAAGNWSAAVGMAGTFLSVGETIRFYKYSSGTYTLIGSIASTTQVQSRSTVSFASTAMATVTFAAGDLLYVDLWWFDNNSQAAGDDPTVYLSTSATAGVASDLQITTANFTAGGGSTPITLADSGTGADSLSVTTAIPLSESGAGADSLGVTTTAPLTDAGAGADSLTLAPIAVALADSGAGADALSITATVALSDAGAGADSLSVAIVNPVTLSDAGTSADSLSVAIVNPISLSDSGVGADTLALAPLVISLTDTGVGAEGALAFTSIALVLSEGGAGADHLTVTILGAAPPPPDGVSVTLASSGPAGVSVTAMVGPSGVSATLTALPDCVSVSATSGPAGAGVTLANAPSGVGVTEQ